MLEDIDTVGSETIPIPFDFKTIGRVFEFLLYERDKEKLGEIEKPVPSSRMEDFVPLWFARFVT